MKNIFYSTLVIILIALGLGLLYLTNTGLLSFGPAYLRAASADFQSPPGPVAFVDVNLIPMDSERILQGQTVLIRDGKIASIGPSQDLAVPDDALVVAASGKYLVPGLVDMHVHIEDENDLLLYAANGVTTVRNMWGNTEMKLAMGLPDQLALRDQINRGELFGPTLYTTGPIMEGDPVTSPMMPVFKSPQQAAAAVAWQAAEGYDFIKVYDYLDAETYQAILEAAAKHGIPVVGHVPFDVGLEAALEGGQTTIEHLSGFIDADAGKFLIDEDQLAQYAELTREAGVWIIPTIGLYQNTVPVEEIPRLESQPGVEYMSPLMRALMRFFIGQLSDMLTFEGPHYSAHVQDMFIRTTRVLREAGAKIALGTDANNSYLVPGYSLLDELDFLIEAGFTPYEALLAGTGSAAEALGYPDVFGTIEVAKRADLILLEGNPLKDVTNVRRQVGVILRGRWLPETELQNMLKGLENSHSPTWIERIAPLGLIGLGVILGGAAKRKSGLTAETDGAGNYLIAR